MNIKSDRAKAWNKANPEEFKANQANYRKRNKKRLTAERRDAAKTPEFKTAASAARLKFITANPWYDSFQAAKARCNNPKNPRYKDYGGQGIRFLLTLEEIKMLWFRDNAADQECPTIDRTENDGNYEFGNCQFIEKGDNSSRKSGNSRERLHRKAAELGIILPTMFEEAT